MRRLVRRWQSPARLRASRGRGRGVKSLRVGAATLIILLVGATVCSAGHYSLAYWRCAGAEEGHGIAAMVVHVFNEQGKPVPNVYVHFSGPLGDKVVGTDYRGYAEFGFQFSGSPASVYCGDPYGSTTDSTPQLYNHDSHRYYEIGFMYRTSASNPGTFDSSWWGDLSQYTQCPSTKSLTFNTPNPLDYSSDTRDLSSNHVWEFGNTFVATADRAVAMRAHLTKGGGTRFRWTAQIFEGGPDGPPMGPKKILYNEYYEGDNKYLLCYTPEECALKVGNTYYVAFATADGSEVNAYECINDVYSGGTLFENQMPVSGKELQAYVSGMSSGNSNVGTVAGTVTDAAGSPIAEAEIVLSGSGQKIHTGKLGTYKCYNVAPGTYSMTVSAPGFQSQTVTSRVVSLGGTLTTDFAIQSAAGPISIQSVTGATIDPGDANIPMSMTVANTGAGDLFVKSAGLRFLMGTNDISGYFAVTPSPSNPAVIRGGGTATFNFSVNSQAGTPSGSITVQGTLKADANLQANGSFETDSSYGAGDGPAGWQFHADGVPSVARLSYQHGVLYSMPGGQMPRTTTKATIRWIGAWSHATDKKQGFKLYVPKEGSSTAVYKLRFDIRLGDHRMEVATGTPDTANWGYYFTTGVFYQIDAWVDASDGEFQVDITPVNGGPVGHCTGKGALSNDTPRIEWGKMYASGDEEMSCREFHYWLEDTTPTELHWLAVNGYLPTDPTGPGCGWGIGGGSPGAPYEQIIAGAPWSPASHCHVQTSDVKEGSKALDIWFSPTGIDQQTYLSSGSGSPIARLQVKPCTTYTISFWYKTINYGGDGYNVRLLWEEYDSSGAPYYYVSPDPQFHWNEPEVHTWGGWRKATYRISTTQWASTAQVQLQLHKPGSEAAAVLVRFDDFRITGPNPYMDTDANAPGTLLVNGVTAVDSVADAKDLADGERISITAVPVTGYPAGQSARFYIEDESRVAGMAVDKTGGTGDLGVVKDDRVTLTGTLATVDGERVLQQIDISNINAGTALAPLAMVNRALGGAASGYTPGVDGGVGANNVGLLVTVWGKINSVGPGFFYVDDGSGVTGSGGSGVKVVTGGLSLPMGVNYIVVTGFSSVENVGGTYYRVIRPRSASDIVSF